MAVGVSVLQPIALTGAPYQVPSWCMGALDPSRASHLPLTVSRAGRPSPRLDRGARGLGGGYPGRDTAPPELGMAWLQRPLGRLLLPSLAMCLAFPGQRS